MSSSDGDRDLPRERSEKDIPALVDDKYGESSRQLLDSRRCAICNDFVIHACRLNCGHIFCRYCIDMKLYLGSEAVECDVCTRAIRGIQNCPEIDVEVDDLFHSLPEGQGQLLREIKKEKRLKMEKELKARVDQNDQKLTTSTSTTSIATNRKNSSDTVRRSQSKPENIPVLEASHVAYPSNVDESQDLNDDDAGASGLNTSAPLVLHETITIHRTRIIGADGTTRDTCRGTTSTSTSPPNISGVGVYDITGRRYGDHHAHATGPSTSTSATQNSYYGTQQGQGNHGTYSYSCYPYQYNNCSYHHQYPSGGYNNCNLQTNQYGYPYPYYSSYSSGSNHRGVNNENASPYSTATDMDSARNPGLVGYYSYQIGSNQDADQNQAQAAGCDCHYDHDRADLVEENVNDAHHGHQNHNHNHFCYLPDEEEEEDEYFEDVRYGGQGYAYDNSQLQPQSNPQPPVCYCSNCSGQQTQQGDNDYTPSDLGVLSRMSHSHFCDCGGISSHNEVYNTFQMSSYPDENHQESSSDSEILYPDHYHETLNNSSPPGRDELEETDPEYEEFLNTFQIMGLSNPFDADGGGSENSTPSGFMV